MKTITLRFAASACATGLLFSLLVASMTAACSSSLQVGGSGSAQCLSAGASACDKACSCTGGGRCAMVLPATSDGGQSGFLTFGDVGSCTTEYQLVCGNSPQIDHVDFDACQAGLAAAACGPGPQGSSPMEGLVLPQACAPLW